MIKGIWRGDDDELCLRFGKEYELLSYEGGGEYVRVVDETGDDYLYAADAFEITQSTYPVVLTQGKKFIVVYIPDFDINTQGTDTDDALSMAVDAIGLIGIDIMDCDEGLPAPTPLEKVKAKYPDGIVKTVEVDFREERKKLGLTNSLSDE